MAVNDFFPGWKAGMHFFGILMNTLINTILLLIVYIVGVGITAIVAKIVGKTFLDTKKKDSYWSELHLKKETLASYFRQF
jgi:hypothetical protein